MNVFEIRNGVYIMKNKKIIILSIVLIIMACIGIGILLYVCNMSKNKPEDVLKQYANYINEQNYEEMYNGNIAYEYINKIIDLRKQLEDLQKLYATDDIEYFTNYLDTSIFILNDEIRALYKKYLKEEIKAENELIGFVNLDLD